MSLRPDRRQRIATLMLRRLDIQLAEDAQRLSEASQRVAQAETRMTSVQAGLDAAAESFAERLAPGRAIDVNLHRCASASVSHHLRDAEKCREDARRAETALELCRAQFARRRDQVRKVEDRRADAKSEQVRLFEHVNGRERDELWTSSRGTSLNR